MKMYAYRETRKKRAREADIVDMYWNHGYLQSKIAADLNIPAGQVAKVINTFWSSKSETEKQQLSDRRAKAVRSSGRLKEQIS
jgi:DNA-binding transcriptional regulator LsrR (DeoR family)